MVEEELKKGNQFEGKEEYIKDVFTEIAEYYDEMNEIMSMGMVQPHTAAFLMRFIAFIV